MKIKCEHNIEDPNCPECWVKKPQLSQTPNKNWEEEFGGNFYDDLIHVLHEYYYTESHEKPLQEAKDRVNELKAFIKQVEYQAYERGQRDMLDSVVKVLPKSIYVNGLRKYKKSIPEINSYNTYRREALEAINNLKNKQHDK